MKRSELIFSILRIPIDAVLIVTAFLLAYAIRLQSDVIYILSLQEYLAFILATLPLWLLVFALEGLYAIRAKRRLLDELSSIFLGASLGVLLVLAAIFLTDTRIGSRIVLFYAYIFTLILVFLGRWAVRLIQRVLYRFDIGTHRVILIGANDRAYQLAREFQTNPIHGYRYLGYVMTNGTDTQRHLGRHLGSLRELTEIVRVQKPDELIVTVNDVSDSRMLALLEIANQERIDLRLTPGLVGVQTTHLQFQTLAGIPVIEVLRTPLQGWGRVMKRLIDIVGASLAIILTSPLMLLTALAVRLTSSGPIIYRNERVGQDKRHFWTYKFRSMKTEYSTGSAYGGEKALKYEQALIAKQNTRQGAVYKVGNDPRLTSIGEFLRKTSLDEFPQFFFVLLGDMSLVGPRPHQPREVAKYEPWQEKLFTIKPGITGLAQVSGRSDLDFDDEARLDISYIENWSVWLDLKLLLSTPMALLASRRRKAS